MTHRHALFRTLIPLAFAACTVAAAALATSPPKPEGKPIGPNRCQDVKTSDWYAWVDKMPGPGLNGPRLHIRANASAKGTGWTYRLNLGPLQEIYPPVQQIEFVATRGGRGSTTATQNPTELHGKFQRAEKSYREIVITCKGKVIARVEPDVVY